jgi:alpha,alpha-trehalose phosphorylase
LTTFDPLDAVLFDLDGVLTPTAEVHMRAWARLFEPFLAERAVAPYTAQDYFDYIDGKPRYEGVASLLASRGIDLPFGDPADAPESDTVCGLGNRKNAVFTAVLESDGVEPYPGSVAFLDALTRRGGVEVAVVSSSKNARPVLAAAGLLDRFDIIVDGVVAAERGIAGKPAPDTYPVRRLPAGRPRVPRGRRRGRPLGRRSGPRRAFRPGAGRRPRRRTRLPARPGRRHRGGGPGRTRRRRERSTRMTTTLSGDPIDRSRYPVDPWTLRETRYEPEDLGKNETLFSVGNGYLGLRGNVEDGRPTPTRTARSSTASTRCGRFATPRTPTGSRRSASRSSTSPTPRSCGSTSTTSPC